MRHATSTRKRRDSKNIDLIDRLENVLDSAEAQTLVWHKMCYAHFTDKSKLERLQKTLAVAAKEETSCSSSGDRCSLRRSVEPVNWNLCIFCQTVLKARLISVMTKQMSDQIIKASSLDYKIGVRLAGVIDLIVAEAKYHLTCLRAFTRSTTKTKQDSDNTDIAMVWLCNELQQSAEKGHVILLNDVWERYKELAEAITCIPDSLYMLLRLIFGGQEALEDGGSENNEDLVQRRVLSGAQDLVYCISGGRKWTPKHIGLASTLHQATRSKDLVELFNKAGHCLSYGQMLQVDTSLAESTLKTMDQATRAIFPPNIVANKFIHYTADNIDILDESLDGKNTFHATQMATWTTSRCGTSDARAIH